MAATQASSPKAPVYLRSQSASAVSAALSMSARMNQSVHKQKHCAVSKQNKTHRLLLTEEPSAEQTRSPLWPLRKTVASQSQMCSSDAEWARICQWRDYLENSAERLRLVPHVFCTNAITDFRTNVVWLSYLAAITCMGNRHSDHNASSKHGTQACFLFFKRRRRL
eukprot:1236707-Rhodomonas_salina.4